MLRTQNQNKFEKIIIKTHFSSPIQITYISGIENSQRSNRRRRGFAVEIRLQNDLLTFYTSSSE